MLKDLKSQFSLTYIFISHNLRVVKKISDRIAVMYKGKIVEWGGTQDIFTNPLHPYTRELLAAAMHYQTSSQKSDFVLPSNGQYVDRGNNHFVLEPEF